MYRSVTVIRIELCKENAANLLMLPLTLFRADTTFLEATCLFAGLALRIYMSSEGGGFCFRFVSQLDVVP